MSPQQRWDRRLKRARTDEMRAALGLEPWQWEKDDAVSSDD